MSAYLKFFQLEQSPFEGRAQSQVVLGTRALRDAFAAVRAGLDEGASRICVSGGPGLGKTSLARAMPKLLRESARVAVVPDPSIGWAMARGPIARQWGLDGGALSRPALLAASDARPLVLVLDQAELADEDFLDHVDVLLSYRTEEDTPVVQSVLFARLPGDPKTEAPPILWWLDRLQTLQLQFAPLPRDGVAAYIAKHLRRAGWRGDALFDDDAAHAIHGYTGGVPGEISDLGERLLVEAARLGRREIDADFVHAFCDPEDADEGIEVEGPAVEGLLEIDDIVDTSLLAAADDEPGTEGEAVTAHEAPPERVLDRVTSDAETRPAPTRAGAGDVPDEFDDLALEAAFADVFAPDAEAEAAASSAPGDTPVPGGDAPSDRPTSRDVSEALAFFEGAAGPGMAGDAANGDSIPPMDAAEVPQDAVFAEDDAVPEAETDASDDLDGAFADDDFDLAALDAPWTDAERAALLGRGFARWGRWAGGVAAALALVGAIVFFSSSRDDGAVAAKAPSRADSAPSAAPPVRMPSLTGGQPMPRPDASTPRLAGRDGEFVDPDGLDPRALRALEEAHRDALRLQQDLAAGADSGVKDPQSASTATASGGGRPARFETRSSRSTSDSTSPASAATDSASGRTGAAR